MSEMNFDEWKDELMPALSSKAEEWQMLGYEKVTVEDVWQCITVKWRKDIKRGDLEEPLRVHRLIGDVFSLKSSEYMNFLTIEAYKAPNFFEQEGEEAFNIDDFNMKDFSKR